MAATFFESRAAVRSVCQRPRPSSWHGCRVAEREVLQGGVANAGRSSGKATTCCGQRTRTPSWSTPSSGMSERPASTACPSRWALIPMGESGWCSSPVTWPCRRSGLVADRPGAGVGSRPAGPLPRRHQRFRGAGRDDLESGTGRAGGRQRGVPQRRVPGECRVPRRCRGRPVGFRLRGPGRPLYDVAAMARMCIPLDTPADALVWGWGPFDPFGRLRLVADSYGLSSGREELVHIIEESMTQGGEFVRRRVERHPMLQPRARKCPHVPAASGRRPGQLAPGRHVRRR